MTRSLLGRERSRDLSRFRSARSLVSQARARRRTDVLDTVVVEGDRVNVIPTEPLESVFGFGKTAVETPRSVTTISSEMLTR